jgi:hypothetical protein
MQSSQQGASIDWQELLPQTVEEAQVLIRGTSGHRVQIPDWSQRGHLGRRPLEWAVVDRIILEDGKIRERRSYFDSVPLVRAVALRPRASLPLLLSLVRRRN